MPGSRLQRGTQRRAGGPTGGVLCIEGDSGHIWGWRIWLGISHEQKIIIIASGKQRSTEAMAWLTSEFLELDAHLTPSTSPPSDLFVWVWGS